MIERVTAQIIFSTYEQMLQLQWIYGQKLDGKALSPTADQFSEFAGFFNFIHEYQITVIGQDQLNYLMTLPNTEYNHVLNKLFANPPCLLVITDDNDIPNRIMARSKKHRVAVLRSKLNGQQLIEQLNQKLSSLFATTTTLHGVFMDVLGVGVLLAGDSGIGKSELALGLINCGHRLVADDAVIISKVAHDKLIGSCPPLLQDFLEVRGLGIINIRAMFGDNAIKDNKRLQLIVRVVIMDKQALRAVNRLEGSHVQNNILNVIIPEVTIPVTPGRNLAVLVEAAVRNQILRMTGYDANQEFIARQQQQLKDNTAANDT